MLIATSPRLSEDPYPVGVGCISTKCYNGTSSGNRGDMTFEEHSRHIPCQSTCEYLTDRITTKEPKELCDDQWTINAQSSVYNNFIKPTVMHSDIQHHTKQTSKLQGEDFIYYVQHAEAPFEEVNASLQKDAQTDGCCSFLQTVTVESDESALRTVKPQSEDMLSVQSELGNHLHSPPGQLEHHTKSLQIPTVKLDKLCHPLKTLQSDGHFQSSHIASVQTPKSFASSQSVTVRSEEPFASSQCVAVQSEEPCKSSQSVIVQSEEPFRSSKSGTVQSEMPVKSSHSGTLQSEEPYKYSHSATAKPIEYSQSLTVQSAELLISSRTATVQSEEPTKCLNTATIQSEELCSHTQMSEVQSLKPVDGLKIDSIQSGGSCNSVWNSPDQQGELNKPTDKSPVQSEVLADLPNITFPQSLESISFKAELPIQLKDHYNLHQSALNDLCPTGRAVSSYAEVPHQSVQGTSVQAKCHPPKSTDDQADGTVSSGKNASSQFAEPYYVKQASIIKSEEIYLSCDSRWSDSVTANKVAVEGDLNG